MSKLFNKTTPKLLRKLRNAALLSLVISGLSACSGFSFPGVYKINVQQGNIIDPKQVVQLKLGMSEDQVRYLLGTPLINDSFNPQRWDYIFRIKQGDGKVLQSKLRLDFDNSLLASMSGDAIEKSKQSVELMEQNRALRAQQKQARDSVLRDKETQERNINDKQNDVGEDAAASDEEAATPE